MQLIVDQLMQVPGCEVTLFVIVSTMVIIYCSVSPGGTAPPPLTCKIYYEFGLAKRLKKKKKSKFFPERNNLNL